MVWRANLVFLEGGRGHFRLRPDNDLPDIKNQALFVGKNIVIGSGFDDFGYISLLGHCKSP